MPNELLNRKRWTTRIELSNAMFDHIGCSTTVVGDTPSSTTFHPSSTSACYKETA